MDGQYDYIELDTLDIKGEFMTKDLDRNLEHFTIKPEIFCDSGVLKKDNEIVNFNGSLTIYSNIGEFELWIRNGIVKDFIKKF